MKKAKIALASITMLGIAGSIVAFKENFNFSRPPGYITNQFNGIATVTYTRAVIFPTTAGTVYFTAFKNTPASIYATLSKAE